MEEAVSLWTVKGRQFYRRLVKYKSIHPRFEFLALPLAGRHQTVFILSLSFSFLCKMRLITVLASWVAVKIK